MLTRRLRAGGTACGWSAAVPVPARADLARVADWSMPLDARGPPRGRPDRRIKDVAVVRPGRPGRAAVLTDGRLVIVPGDRHDVVIAACLAALNGIRLAALLLTVGIEPDPRVWELTDAGDRQRAADRAWSTTNTYETVTRVQRARPRPARRRPGAGRAGDGRRWPTASTTQWLDDLRRRTEHRRLSPAAFRYRLVREGAAGRRPHRAARGHRAAHGARPRSSAPSAASCAACCSRPRTRWRRTVAVGLGLELPDGARGASIRPRSPRTTSTLLVELRASTRA